MEERRNRMEREILMKRGENRSRVDGRAEHGGNEKRRRDVYTLEECSIVHHGVVWHS